MDKNEFELVVSPGNQPIHFLALASIFFTAMLFLIYRTGLICYELGFTEGALQFAIRSAELIILCLVLGMRFSTVKEVLIDTDTGLLISRFSVGPISYDVKRKCPHLEYISVFRNKHGMFEVNLWYRKNRHYKMYQFDESDPAFEFARAAAKKLQIDLLDATVANNSKWIDNASLLVDAPEAGANIE